MSQADKKLKKLFKQLDNEAAKPTSEWLNLTRDNLRQHMKNNPMPASPQVEHFTPEPVKYGWLRKPAGVVASVLVVALVLAGGTTYAAQGAEPGDALYPLKIASENFSVFVNVSPEAKAKLYLKYADRRFDELEKLYEKEPENEYWQEKVVQKMSEQIISAKDSMVSLDEQPEFADIALEFETFTEDQDQRLADLKIRLNTTTAIVNRIQELNETNKQKALEALEEAKELIEQNQYDHQDKHSMIKKRLESRLELLRARQKAMHDRAKDKLDKGDIKVKLNGEEIELNDLLDDDSVKLYEVELEDEGLNFESEVEVESEGDEKVETNIDVNDGQVTVDSTIQATGTSIIIKESNTTIATSSSRIEVKGKMIEWRDDFFKEIQKKFGKDFVKFDDEKDEDKGD